MLKWRAFRAWIGSRLKPNGKCRNKKLLQRSKGRTQTLTKQESAFVLTFALHSLYEVSKGNGVALAAIPATKNQLIELMNCKIGIALDADGRQYRRLKPLFISKGTHRALLVELAEMVSEGVRGVPSVFRWNSSGMEALEC